MRTQRILPAGPMLIVLGLPILLLILVPVAALPLSLTPTMLAEALRDPLIWKAVRLSLLTSLLSTTLIVLFGTPLAWLLARGRFAGRNVLEALLELAIVVPPAVAGIGLLMAFGRFGLVGQWLALAGIELPFSTAAVIMAQCFVACPYFIKAAALALSSVDPDLETAAALEGAHSFQILRHILLPAAWSGFVGGAAMSWARALGEFGATIIFAGNYPGRTQTLPLAVYLGLETSTDRAVVLAVILLAFSFTLLYFIHSRIRTASP